MSRWRRQCLRASSASSGDVDPPARSRTGTAGVSAGGVLGWHRRRAAETEVHLLKDWEAFVRARPFWLREQVSLR